MKRYAKFGVSLFLLVLAVATGYYIGIPTGTLNNYQWQELRIEGYAYTPAAFVDSDIALQDIKKLSGRAKFLNPVEIGTGELHLGYIVSVDVETLDLGEVPDKYKEERKVNSKAGEFTLMPTEEVYYRMAFEFTLKDKDGFDLAKLAGPKHSLVSGRDNHYQDKVSQPVSETLAAKTAEVVLYMWVEECETCRAYE